MAVGGGERVSADPEDLEPFIGRWRMVPGVVQDPDDAPPALTTFEWLEGGSFLIQRWHVDHPDAPDGIAVIGADPATGGYLQHYFDSRGVSRVYDMGFADDVWTLRRIAGPPDFSQRFTARFGDGGGTLTGTWEISHDGGSTWSPDFDLTYTRLPGTGATTIRRPDSG
jgi:hypothetical protein